MYDGWIQKDFSKRHPVFAFGCHATATALHPLCAVCRFHQHKLTWIFVCLSAFILLVFM